MKSIDEIKEVMDRMHNELEGFDTRINNKLEVVNTEIRKEADALMNSASGVMVDLATMSRMLSKMEDQLSQVAEAEKQEEWPQTGDAYYFLRGTDGVIAQNGYDADDYDAYCQSSGNFHRTKEQAQRYKDWLTAPRTQARRMVEMCDGFDAHGGIFMIARDERLDLGALGEYTDGGLQFNNTEKASAAIDKLGAPLIKVALGVIDGEEAEKIVREAMMREWK